MLSNIFCISVKGKYFPEIHILWISPRFWSCMKVVSVLQGVGSSKIWTYHPEIISDIPEEFLVLKHLSQKPLMIPSPASKIYSSKTLSCHHQISALVRGSRCSSERVWTGLQWWPLDVSIWGYDPRFDVRG